MSSLLKDRFRFVIIGLTLMMALVNYIDRGAISYASAAITKEYQLDRQAWGAVLGYFGYGYMLGALVGGTLGDRFGPKRVWAVAATAWSILEISTAYAGNLGVALFGGSALAGFALVRILFGASEGPAYSMINKTVRNWSSGRERGFSVSLGLLSTPLGALLTAPVAVGLLTLTGEWRVMFVYLGGVGLLALIPFLLIFTDRPQDSMRVSAQEREWIAAGDATPEPAAPAAPSPVASVGFFRNPSVMFNAVGYFAYLYVNFMLLTWTPKYLQDQFQFSMSELWYVGMIPWAGPCVTMLLGGRLSDFVLKRTGSLWKARSLFASSILLLTTVVFALVPLATSAVAVIALICVGNSLNNLANPVYWAVVLDQAPHGRVGTWSGITHCFANSASVLAPTLTGVLAARYGYESMFIATAIVTGIGTLSMLLVGVGRQSRGAALAGAVQVTPR